MRAGGGDTRNKVSHQQADDPIRERQDSSSVGQPGENNGNDFEIKPAKQISDSVDHDYVDVAADWPQLSSVEAFYIRGTIDAPGEGCKEYAAAATLVISECSDVGLSLSSDVVIHHDSRHDVESCEIHQAGYNELGCESGQSHQTGVVHYSASAGECTTQKCDVNTHQYMRCNSLPTDSSNNQVSFMVSECEEVMPVKLDLEARDDREGSCFSTVDGQSSGMGGGGDATNVDLSCLAVQHSLSEGQIAPELLTFSQVSDGDRPEPLYIPASRNYCMPSEKPEHVKRSRRSSLLHKLMRKKDQEIEKPEKQPPAQAPGKLVRAVSEYNTTQTQPSTGMNDQKHKSDPYLNMDENDGEGAFDKAEVYQEQNKMRSFVRRVTSKIRHSMAKAEETSKRRKSRRFEMIDLTSEDVPSNPPCRKMSYKDIVQLGTLPACT